MSGHVLFDGVWKRFRRGLSHDSLRDLIPAMARRLRPGPAPDAGNLRVNDFWAIKDVSFEVKPGQALGIIGGNGAGKSTALKLLTRILVPTRGVAAIRGRAGALIEVSAGFHPDLTGRENVFLQGAIMGMPMQLIRTRFDDIVDFSGISQFIDTPVKRYSSGMNARLGFSIAAHLEPEVLIIDEVLSVGDAQFQTRAFDRIKGLVSAGIPVVIVSHQLDRIVELCTDCILLRQGQVAYQGTPRETVQAYLQGAPAADAPVGEPAVDSFGLRLISLDGPEPQPVPSGGTFTCRVTGEINADTPPPDVDFGLAIVDAATNHSMSRVTLRGLGAHPVRSGPFTAEVQMQANFPAGLYRLDSRIWHSHREILIPGPHRMFQVTATTPFQGSHQINAVAALIS